jgi:hypothetical protein
MAYYRSGAIYRAIRALLINDGRKHKKWSKTEKLPFGSQVISLHRNAGTD